VFLCTNWYFICDISSCDFFVCLQRVSWQQLRSCKYELFCLFQGQNFCLEVDPPFLAPLSLSFFPFSFFLFFSFFLSFFLFFKKSQNFGREELNPLASLKYDPGLFHYSSKHFVSIDCGRSFQRALWYFYARKQLLLSERLSNRNFIRLSVRPSFRHTGGSVKNGAS